MLLYFIVWIIVAFLVGKIGAERRIGYWGAFWWSFLLSPIIGLLVTIASKRLIDIEKDEKLVNLQEKQTEYLQTLTKPAKSLTEELTELSNLKEKGYITDEIFGQEKEKILKKHSPISQESTKTYIERPIVSRPSKEEAQVPSRSNLIYYIYGIGILIFLALQFFGSGGDPVETSWQEVKNKMLKDGDVSKIVIVNKEKAEVYIKSDSYEKYKEELSKGFLAPSKTGPHYYFVIGTVETFEANLERAHAQLPEENRVELMFETRRDIFMEVLSYILPVLLLIGLLWLIAGRRGGGTNKTLNGETNYMKRNRM